jgi:hypothetical protein
VLPPKKLTPMCDCLESACLAKGGSLEELYAEQSRLLERDFKSASRKAKVDEDDLDEDILEKTLDLMKLDPLEPKTHEHRVMNITSTMKGDKCKYCGSYVYWQAENLPKHPPDPFGDR